eukprot:15482109-Alexandrium_andersonii.AAC.1
MRQALAAHAEPRCPNDGHEDPRNDPGKNDGEAIIAGGARARVPMAAAVRTAGLCMCSVRVAHVQWPSCTRA